MENNPSTGVPEVAKPVSVFTKLKALWEATTSGEWFASHGDGRRRTYSSVCTRGGGTILERGRQEGRSKLLCGAVDAEFIAFAHNNVGRMIEEVNELTRELEDLREDYHDVTQGYLSLNEHLEEKYKALKKAHDSVSREYYATANVLSDVMDGRGDYFKTSKIGKEIMELRKLAEVNTQNTQPCIG